MEAVIQRIIELEERARQIVADGQEEESLILAKGEAEIREMASHIHEMSETKISQLKGRTQYESDDRIIRIYQDTAMKMRLMEEQAEQDQACWEDEVFTRIVGR